MARYGDVPVLSGDNNILTSNKCPGTLQRDVKMDQEAEDATQPGGAIIGPRGAVGCKGEGGDVRRGRFETSWEEIRKSRESILDNTEKWQQLAESERRKLEREGRKIEQELLKRRREKFGRAGGKKLSVLEVVIIKNQVMKRAEIAEVEQNIKRENLRRRGKKKNGLEPCDFQERKMWQEG